MSDIQLDQTAAIAKAKKEKRSIRKGTSDTLLLDLDDCDVIDAEMFQWVAKRLGEMGISITLETKYISNSGAGVHVVYRLSEKLPVTQLIIIESVLGSDLKRSMFNLMRFRLDSKKDPRMLFGRFPLNPKKEKRKSAIPDWPQDFVNDVPFLKVIVSKRENDLF